VGVEVSHFLPQENRIIILIVMYCSKPTFDYKIIGTIDSHVDEYKHFLQCLKASCLKSLLIKAKETKSQ